MDEAVAGADGTSLSGQQSARDVVVVVRCADTITMQLAVGAALSRAARSPEARTPRMVQHRMEALAMERPARQ